MKVFFQKRALVMCGKFEKKLLENMRLYKIKKVH
jgi:hypothetical protein